MSPPPTLNIENEVAAVAPPANANAKGRKRSSLKRFISAIPGMNAVRSRIKPILSAIPGTRAFRQRVRESILKDARRRRQAFVLLSSLDSTSKDQIRPRVRRFQNRLAVIGVWETTVTVYITVLFLVGAFLAVGYVEKSGMPDPLSTVQEPGGWLGLLLSVVMILMFFGWVFVFLWPTMIANKYKFLVPASLQITWLILAVAGYAISYYYLATNLNNWSTSKYLIFTVVIMRGAYIFLGLLFVFMIIMPVIVALTSAFERRRRSLYPQAVISESLMTVLIWLDIGEDEWMESANRAEIVTGLERAASCLERNLAGQLRAGDTLTNVQVSNATAEMAYALRSLKQWALTPKPDTYEHLRRRVAESFLSATRGHWDSLPRATPPKLTLAEGVSSKASRALKTLLSGSIPLVTLVAVRRLGIPLEGQIGQYATLGVILWSALTLLRLIDPEFKSTLEASSVIKNIFTRGGEK